MLQLLHIENIAVIEKTDIEFDKGFNVLTGETGAGKSIIIDALGAVLGSRTSRELVRTGTENALVNAVFSDENAGQWCDENGIDHSDGELILMRRISAEGKNSCRINGMPVTVAQLRELGELLLDVHGQNDGQRLLDEKYHLEYLDSFGEVSEIKKEYTEAYFSYLETKKEIKSLSMDESEKERRIDSLNHQIDEIERASIKPGELSQLTERRNFMKNAGKLSEAVNSAFYAIYGGDRNSGALDMIEEAASSMSNAVKYSESVSILLNSIDDLKYAAEDVAEQLRDLRSGLDFSPNELDEVENRFDLLKRILRKYGPDEQDVLYYLEKIKNELSEIEYSSEKLVKLEAELSKKYDAAMKAAEKLSKKRKKAAEELEKRVKTELSELSMPGVRFKVGIDECRELTKEGIDEVKFLMSANAGEAIGKISKIASGGELARIMLAMKNVLAEGDNIGTMVFDEVDTGVSGIAAQRVGEKIAALSRKRQVICVTHLPQIAAMADTHFVIAKTQRDGRTFTNVTKLDSQGRMGEIARLTGGENITDITLSAASEQLTAAENFKAGL